MKKALLALALTAAFGVANAAQNVNTDVVIVGAGGVWLLLLKPTILAPR